MTNDIRTTGAKVEGTYMGEPFKGTVRVGRYHTINHRVSVIHVDLDQPTVIGGSERTGVCLEVAHDGGYEPSYGLDYGDRIRLA